MPVKKSGLQKNIEDVDPYNLGVDAENTAEQIRRAESGQSPDKYPSIKLIKKIRYPENLKEYKKGGIVQETGPAIIHKGELIIPKHTGFQKMSSMKRLMGMATKPMKPVKLMKKGM
jgi:hypothetical protein